MEGFPVCIDSITIKYFFIIFAPPVTTILSEYFDHSQNVSIT